MFIVTEKKCCRCGVVKKASDFSPSKKSKDGLYSACKRCIADYRRERVANNPSIVEKVRIWTKNNLDKFQGYREKYYSKNRDLINRAKRERRKSLEVKAKTAEYNKKYYAANPTKKKEIAKKWRLENPERVKTRIRKWQENNREIVNAHARNYRAKTNGNGGKITVEEWEELKVRYNFTCLRCGRQEPEIKLTLDHVIPISKGGENTTANAQPLCGSCNTAKKDREIDYRKHWRQF